MEEQVKKKGITKNGIKMVAIITMFIDHFAAILFETALMNAGSSGVAVIGGMQIDFNTLYMIDFCMRMIGRIAFPIFCYSLVEGFCYTKNVWKYVLRLAVFAIVTEVPFDLAFKGKWMDWSYQNVLITMLFGLLTLMAMKFVEQKLITDAKTARTENRIANIALQSVSLLAGISLAELCNTDYSGMGILTIVIMYYLREKKKKFAVLASFLGAIFIALPNFGMYLEQFRSAFAMANLQVSISPYAPTIIVFFIIIPAFTALLIFLFSRIKRADMSALGGGIMILTVMSLNEIFAFFGLIALGLYSGERGKSSGFMKYFFYWFYPVHILLIFLLAVALGVCRIPGLG